MLHYFKRHWEEVTGEPNTESWGTSTFYFETTDTGEVLRQIQVFENGRKLSYSHHHDADDFGMLADQPIDMKEFEAFRIEQGEFETAWL